MYITRNHLIQSLSDFIHAQEKNVCVLYGPRQAWKTTVLKQTYETLTSGRDIFWYSFDEEITPKQFHTLHDFLHFFSTRFGFAVQKKQILFLNETQYSHHLEQILIEYTTIPDVQAKIIATGVNAPTFSKYPKIQLVPIFPLSFPEYLHVKNISLDTVHLGITSKIILKEIQSLYDDYLTWGWYPSVLIASTVEEKMRALRLIIQWVYEKDIWFVFNGYDMVQFEPMLHLAYHATKSVYKISSLAQFADVKSSLVQQYMDFFEHNHLIDRVDYAKTSDNAKEIHHQKKLLFSDTWIMTALTKDMTTKLTSLRYQMSFLYREIRLLPWIHAITTYKKINGSVIDFVITLTSGKRIIICCEHDQRVVLPKVVPSYIALTGDSVIWIIKTWRLVNTMKMVTLWSYTMPFLITQPFLVTEAIRLLIARQTSTNTD